MREPRGFFNDSAMPKNVSASRTVSRAIEKEERIDTVWVAMGLRGALFWIPRATLAILRREEEEESGPKEME